MLESPVAFDRADPAFFNGDALVIATIGFQGAYTGTIYLYSDAGFAQRVTNHMLCLSSNDNLGEGMVNDAVGELANMIAGLIKSSLAGGQHACLVTIPSVVRGCQQRAPPLQGTERGSVSFRCNGEGVFVEAFIKPAEE